MATDVGSQTITIIYNAQALSRTVNTRHQNIRELGIYSGGYLSIVDGANCSITTLICEISDGTYQVKVETGAAVNLAVAAATPYVVLRWAYTGSAVNDYMAILAVDSPATNDVVVGKCSFTEGGVLQGFLYVERTTPNILDLFLKVEETATSELRVRVRAGRVQNGKETMHVSEQKSDLFPSPIANSKVYLVYLNRSTGAITIDSSGVEAASPVAPNYAGKLVLAEVTLSSVSVNILQSNIMDVRDFASMSYDVDDSTIEVSSAGKLAAKGNVLGQSVVVSGDSELVAPSSYELVTGMTVNMTTTGGRVAVDFSTVVSCYGNQSILVRMYLDGSSVIGSKAGVGPFGEVALSFIPLSMNWLFALAAGTYSFQIYWKGVGAVNQYMNKGVSETTRVLRVIELPHSV